MKGKLEDGKISSYQFKCLVILFTIGTTILVIPKGLASNAKQDAWIAAIFGVGIGVFVIWIYNKLSIRFPHMTFVQMNETVFGKWLGKGFSVIFLSMSFTYTAIVMFYTGNFIRTQLYPETPLEIIHIVLALILVMGVRHGLETFTRTAEIFLLFFFFLFVFLVIFISPQIQFENIEPVFDVDAKPLASSMLSLVVTSSINSVVLLMIFPAYVNQTKESQKAFLIGNLLGGFVMIMITLLCIFVLGANITAMQMFPSYALAKKLDVGNFIQRIEAMLAIMWFISVYFKMVIYFYASCLGMAQVLNLNDYRPLIFPLGMISVVFSLTAFPNVVYQQEWDTKTSEPFSISVGFILPLLLIVVDKIREKKCEKNRR
ncbi:endospore germination permease [Bacillus sp. FJAT-47783]|uniref:GerAB/ArcD/ProY family transporter n=1 Tax=Bacillus sp. FJAT-47783 TaxID=2922712 RepID=UPI001FAE1550